MSFDFSVSVYLPSARMPTPEVWRNKLDELGFSFGPLGATWNERAFQPIDALPNVRLEWEENPNVEEIVEDFEDEPEIRKALEASDLQIWFNHTGDWAGKEWSDQAMDAATASAVALAMLTGGVLQSTTDGPFVGEDAIQAVPLPFEIYPEEPAERIPDSKSDPRQLIAQESRVSPSCWDVGVGDRLQVAFLDSRSKQVKLATHTDNKWTVESVAKGMDDGEVFLDHRCAALHLVFVQRRPNYVREVMYSRQEPQTWQDEPVAREFRATSFALDGAKYPLLIGLDIDAKTLISMQRTEEGWIRSTICPEWASESTLAIGADGKPHVCYCEDRKDGLRYAVMVGDEWRTDSLVPVESPVCLKPTVVLCETRRYVAFNHDGRLHLATSPLDGPWSVEVVREEGSFLSSGVPVSMWIASDQTVYLGYVVHDGDDDTSMVKMARRTNDGWSVTDIAGAEYGWETWIGQNAKGGLCIVYRDQTDLYFVDVSG
jgi:hypothetical protein